jgi:hypothetical protein
MGGIIHYYRLLLAIILLSGDLGVSGFALKAVLPEGNMM